MKKKAKAIVARSAGDLAEVLGLERADGIEIAVRSALNTKVIQVIEKRGLTHAHVAGAGRYFANAHHRSDQSEHQVGQKLALSRERIRQIEAEALGKLHRRAASEKLESLLTS